jgi:osmotically-inducible protein OsmY
MSVKLSIIAFALVSLIGCSENRAPDVTGKVRDSLKQAGLNDVTVSQDRDKGVVTLGGKVQRQGEKDQAEEIAKQSAAGQVVADQIEVLSSGDASADRSVDSDLDKGIEANLDAAFTKARIKGVSHSTTNGVVTLKGNLDTPAHRTDAERIASEVSNVRQVVNEINVKNQRATTSSGDRSK